MKVGDVFAFEDPVCFLQDHIFRRLNILLVTRPNVYKPGFLKEEWNNRRNPDTRNDHDKDDQLDPEWALIKSCRSCQRKKTHSVASELLLIIIFSVIVLLGEGEAMWCLCSFSFILDKIEIDDF